MKMIVSQVERELAEFDVGIYYMQRMGILRETGLIAYRHRRIKNMYTFSVYC
jgi:hypothetical protein